jgi:hypothetical protein
MFSVSDTNLLHGSRLLLLWQFSTHSLATICPLPQTCLNFGVLGNAHLEHHSSHITQLHKKKKSKKKTVYSYLELNVFNLIFCNLFIFVT